MLFDIVVQILFFLGKKVSNACTYASKIKFCFVVDRREYIFPIAF